MEVKFKERKAGICENRDQDCDGDGPGLGFEADQRHADISMKDARVDESREGVVGPGAASIGEGGQRREGEARQRGGESLLRAVAARGNYVR